MMGPSQAELELSVNHSSDNPGSIRVLRSGGNSDPAAVSGSFLLFTVTFTPLAGGTSNITGTVAVLRDAALNQIGAPPQVIGQGVTAQGRFSVYVDFDSTGQQRGTLADPYITIAQAVNGTASGGTANIYAGETPETITINKNIRLAVYGGGIVRIGVLGARSSTVPAAGLTTESLVMPASGSWNGYDLLAAILANLRANASASVDETGHVFEKALPKPAAPAEQAQVYAVRLRAESTIDPATVWGTVSGGEIASAGLEIIPIAPNDLWVVYRSAAGLQPGETLHFTAGAAGVSAVTQVFDTVAPSASGDAIEQPLYEDLDTSGLDLVAESNTQSALLAVGAPALPGGLGAPLSIAPSRVFDTPQRVWLSLPEGTDAGAVELFYYYEEDGERAWYRGEHVEGWLVAGSELQVSLGGQDFYGFSVHHGGIVQLRPSGE
ncbi:MAG: hypothetical protein HYV26_15355 [Candidatus Hydrogenedentes bacterium]|nr:hypothetical protein [Candidatus Hydrogenedentota bacterium]